jgi:hypothetical protein
MTTTSPEQLSRRIEQLIHEHIVASERAAADAIARAFARASASGRVARVASGPAGRERKRRASGEIAALGQRLYQAVCDKPGETMAVLAADVGMLPSQLQLPMAQLREAGQVRTVGQRHLTRYFPLSAKS